MNDINHFKIANKRLDLSSIDNKGILFKSEEPKKNYFINKKSGSNFKKTNFFNQSIEKYTNNKKIFVDKITSLNNSLKNKIVYKSGKDLIKFTRDNSPYELPFKPNLNIKSKLKKNPNETCDKSPNTSIFEIKNNLENYVVNSKKLRNTSLNLYNQSNNYF